MRMVGFSPSPHIWRSSRRLATIRPCTKFIFTPSDQVGSEPPFVRSSSQRAYSASRSAVIDSMVGSFVFLFLLCFGFVSVVRYFVVVQSLSHVRLFATPFTAAYQAFLYFTISQTLFKRMSIESVTPSSHLVLCHPPAFSFSQHQGLFQ